jgi:hypothetical protein
MTSKVTVKENKPVHGKNRHPTEHRDEESRRPRVDSGLQSIYISLESSGNKADNAHSPRS